MTRDILHRAYRDANQIIARVKSIMMETYRFVFSQFGFVIYSLWFVVFDLQFVVCGLRFFALSGGAGRATACSTVNGLTRSGGWLGEFEVWKLEFGV